MAGSAADLQLHASDDVDEYAAHAAPFLLREPVERNVLLTVIDRVRRGRVMWTAPPGFWWLSDGENVVAAASWTPPYGLLVSSMPREAMSHLAAAGLQRASTLGIRLPGVNGPSDVARAIAGELAARTGARVVEHMRMLVHDLESLLEVPRPSGESRRATADDAPLVIEWTRSFAEEAHATVSADIEAVVRSEIDASRTWLWVDGSPRSTASQHVAAGGVVRIGPVYTPPSERGHGYARRLVHDVSAAALQMPGVSGCTLNTDATNPVSNAIYQQIGYVPVAEHAEYRLVS